MNLKELEREKTELKKICVRCCFCEYNMSCDFDKPYCELLDIPVEIGTKCLLENNETV